MFDLRPLPPRRWWLAAAALIIAAVALVDVTIAGPRIVVHWRAELDDAARVQLEARYSLIEAAQQAPDAWRYRLADRSPANLAALLRNPAVAATDGIDPVSGTAGRPEVAIAIRTLPFPFNADRGFPDRSQLFQLQSACTLGVGLGLLVAAGRPDLRRRRLAIGLLAIFGLSAFAFPIDQTLRMGDSGQYLSNRGTFEAYVGGSVIRFEAHLSYAIIGRVYSMLGAGAEAPLRAFMLLMHAATVWFVAGALTIGQIERWSAHVVRYLGLSLIAPAALLFFGYREIGHLSLNLAAFPLLLRGLRTSGRPPAAGTVAAGAGLAGLGAALHGFGLLALAGSVLAVLAAPLALWSRARHAVRVAAWGTAAYLGWLVVYPLLGLSLTRGHTDAIPWRPWVADQLVGTRVNAALLSPTGARDLLFTAWVVGAPLLAVAAFRWRRQDDDDVRMALAYAVPSVAFSIVFWPVQGLGLEMDLLVAAFPAVYAFAWVCARRSGTAWLAAALLASGHLAFWRILLDARFIN